MSIFVINLFKIYNIIIFIYYTLRFYFPYSSLLAQPVNILVCDPNCYALFVILYRKSIGFFVYT